MKLLSHDVRSRGIDYRLYTLDGEVTKGRRWRPGKGWVEMSIDEATEVACRDEVAPTLPPVRSA